MHVQEHPDKSPDIVRFLKHLLRHIPGKLLVLWDGARRIRLEQPPGYAPDLNPDEGTWHYLKHVELGNVCCQTLPHLRRQLRLATARLRHKRHAIQGCMRECGYHV
jgi:hypothetical protein